MAQTYRNNRNKRHRTEHSGPRDFIPDDIAGHIMGFCDQDRYLTVGIVNKQFNHEYGKGLGKRTCTLGFLESDTVLVDNMGREVFPGDDPFSTLARSAHHHGLIHKAIDRGLEWDHFCVEDPARRGNKGFFRWIEESDLFWLPENAYSSAAYYGNTEMMDFFLSSGFGFPDKGCVRLAKESATSTEELKTWIETIEKTDGYILSRAVKDNDTETVKRMYSRASRYDRILQDAIVYNFVEMVHLLISLGEDPTYRDVGTAEYMLRDDILDVLEPWF
jgi:hypothetical protein